MNTGGGITKKNNNLEAMLHGEDFEKASPARTIETHSPLGIEKTLNNMLRDMGHREQVQKTKVTKGTLAREGLRATSMTRHPPGAPLQRILINLYPDGASAPAASPLERRGRGLPRAPRGLPGGFQEASGGLPKDSRRAPRGL